MRKSIRDFDNYELSRQRPSFTTADKLLFLFVGGGIGAGLALLFAPKSGAELRGDLSDLSRRGYDETRVLAQQVKESSAGVYNSIRDQGEKIYDAAAARLTRGSEAGAGLENAFSEDEINGRSRTSTDPFDDTPGESNIG